MLRYFVILKCDVVKTKTPRDTEVLTAGKNRYRMLRCFVILKCEEKKRLRMLRYFVILKCEVVSKTLHAYCVILKCEVITKRHRMILKC